MRELSLARRRTLELQDRAITFSVAVNAACPENFVHVPSKVVWEQLIRAADSTSNNLVEADDASGDADFVYKMRVALREAKESRTCLRKIRLGRLAHHDKISGLEQEAWELRRSSRQSSSIQKPAWRVRKMNGCEDDRVAENFEL